MTTTRPQDTITLKLKTVRGFVNRGGDFEPRDDGPFIAEQWVSEFLNPRLKTADEQAASGKP